MLVSAAYAGMIYDNTGAVSSGADCVGVDLAGIIGGCQPIYNSFTVPVAGQLTDIKLVLSGNAASSGDISIAIAMGFPQPSFYIGLTLLPDSRLSNTQEVYDVPIANGPTLSANTMYWVLLYGSGGTGVTTTAEWWWSSDLTALGVSGEFFSNGNGTFPDSSGAAYQMAVTEEPVPPPPAPEPGSFLLAVPCALLFCFLRRGAAVRCHPAPEGESQPAPCNSICRCAKPR